MNYQELYPALGKLFYAIASSDGKVEKAETLRLKEDLDAIWLPMESSTDLYGSDAAHSIWFNFELCFDGEWEAADAWAEFLGYYRIHESAFDAELKSRINKSAAAIAHSFSGFNKAELEYLSKLHLTLNES
ncbi:MAG: hypothetical protein EP332_07540 [Bacteroidetes bacterium]|nr:MAG: hypothetical protein EP332_07540 [Bacteroidota bacterium]